MAALLAMVLLMVTYFAFEPAVSRAVDSAAFTVSQSVSSAIAFSTQPSDVTLSGPLNGLTGGTGTGQTGVRIRTNNASGYHMTIKFSSTTAMLRGGDLGAREILNYQYSTGTASYPVGFNANGNAAQFGFTVNASNTTEISSVFTGASGSACGTGAGINYTLNDCWRGASSTDVTAGTQLMNTSAPTSLSGSTSTIIFQVIIPNGPSPAVPNGTYVATATLTALDN